MILEILHILDSASIRRALSKKPDHGFLLANAIPDLSGEDELRLLVSPPEERLRPRRGAHQKNTRVDGHPIQALRDWNA